MILKVLKVGLLVLLVGWGGGARANNCEVDFARIEGTSELGRRYADLGDEIQRAFAGNLYDFQAQTSPEFTAEWNRGLLQGLRELPFAQRNPKRMSGLTDQQLGRLFWSVKNHPLAAPKHTLSKKYDRENRGIGFCFGKAELARRNALVMGLAKESMRKVWAVGPMKTADGMWQHHVALAVRAQSGEWFAIDPLDRRALPLADWFESVKRNYPSPNLQLFATDAKRFSPYDQRAILPITARSPGYNGYFEDLLKWSREDARAIRNQKRGIETCAREKKSAWTCLKETFGIFD